MPQLVVLITPEPLEADDLASRYARLGTTRIEDSGRLVVEMSAGYFVIDLAADLAGEYEDVELAKISELIDGPHFAPLEFRTRDDLAKALLPLTGVRSVLVDDDHGAILPLADFQAALFRAGVR